MSLATFIKFFEVSALAGLLLLPYLAWSCFASTLINLSISHADPQVFPCLSALVQKTGRASSQADDQSHPHTSPDTS